jgi:hypothetical protein
MKNNKKALSPVIATMLLVALSVVLGSIIFLWARSFIGESITKDGEDVLNSCKDLDLEIEIVRGVGADTVRVANNGGVPLYRLKITGDNIDENDPVMVGSLLGINIKSGATWENSEIWAGYFSAGEVVRVIPLIAGEDSSGEVDSFECSASYVDVEVK